MPKLSESLLEDIERVAYEIADQEIAYFNAWQRGEEHEQLFLS